MISLSDTFNRLSNVKLDSSDSAVATLLFRAPPAVQDFQSRIRTYQDSYLYLNSELVEGAVPTTPQRLEHIVSAFATWPYDHREVLKAAEDLSLGFTQPVDVDLPVEVVPPSWLTELIGFSNSLKSLSPEFISQLVIAGSRVLHNTNVVQIIQAISAYVVPGSGTLSIKLGQARGSEFEYISDFLSPPNGAINVIAPSFGNYTGDANWYPNDVNGADSLTDMIGDVIPLSNADTTQVLSLVEQLKNNPDIPDVVPPTFEGRAVATVDVHYVQNSLKPHIYALGLCLRCLSDVGLELSYSVDSIDRMTSIIS